jgi:hypothetical protein
MVSAISFGVFWRFAPSTIAIMRSRKVLPGSEVMRMTMRSLMTRVPPVTALRSPPLSRMTGADSPVMAASSTLAMPSMTSPSAGITSPASQTTRSPFSRSAEPGRFLAPFLRRRAMVSLRAARRLSRLRLATAFGDGFGEVGEEHGEPEPERELEDEAVIGLGGEDARGGEHRADEVTNMTGFFTIRRGSSFLNASADGGTRMEASKRDRFVGHRGKWSAQFCAGFGIVGRSCRTEDCADHI